MISTLIKDFSVIKLFKCTLLTYLAEVERDMSGLLVLASNKQSKE